MSTKSSGISPARGPSTTGSQQPTPPTVSPALRAARRFSDVGVDQPNDLARLPLGGRRLRAELRAAADGLARRAAGRDLAAYRSGLTRAVILAALGEHDAAVAAASRALDLS